ncbi:MAG: hypothetical protein EOO07_10350, partial [Chitinophagaceae bacterium]
RSAYTKARIFPGLVDASEPRLTDAKFTLDLNFVDQTSENLRIKVAPRPQFSTGYYAAPGELIKLIVPEGVNGLSMQIGGHTDNLAGKAVLLRDPLIFTVKALHPGVNYIRNLYGGTIYIKASFAIPQPVEFTISGACVSPDFILNESNHAEWKARILASKVPWLELRSKYVIFLVPRDKIIAQFTNATEPLNDMELPLKLWADVFKFDFNGWMGLSDDAPDVLDRSPQGAWRGVLDIQLSAGYGHAGFPFVGYNDSEWFGGFTSAKRLTTSELTWGAYHEFGHNCQQSAVWSWSTLGETTNNLFNFKVAKRINANYLNLHENIPGSFAKSITWASSAIGARNFDNLGDPVMENDPFARMTPFIQIFELYGYNAMTHLYTEARHAKRLANNDQDKRDFVYEKLSEYTATDLIAFFKAWGIVVSSLSQDRIGAKFPYLTKQIWTYNPITKTGGTGVVQSPFPEIRSVSSNAANEGSPNNLLDGNTATFWISNTTPPSNQFPISVELTLGRIPTPIKGFTITQRNAGSANPKTLEIFLSSDGSNYTSAGTFVAQNVRTKQDFNFAGGTKTARYIKLVIKDIYSTNVFVAMSEFNVIKP